MTLGDALVRHRAQHGCDALHCEAYLDIARHAIRLRQIPHAPRMACWRLSVREAQLPDRSNP